MCNSCSKFANKIIEALQFKDVIIFCYRFTTRLATRFLSWNDRVLQLRCNIGYFYGMSAIGQVPWVAMDTTHHIWSHIPMQLMHSVVIVQLQCNKFSITVVTSHWHWFLFIHPSINDELCWFLLQFFCNYGCGGKHINGCN